MKTSEPLAFRRSIQRIGPVPTRIRITQGVGALPDVFKDFAVKTFLLLYYNQVLGLPAFYVSVALAAALVVDAITDPLVGSYSDNFRSRLGRRHPFMYASALPLGICVYLLFTPPEIPAALPREPLLLAWLLFFIVAARVCMTFFLIPWGAMFAEYSDDYQERSAIVSYRFLMAWIGGIVFSVSVYTWVFPTTPEYPLGQLNPDSYGTFAWVLAVSVIVAVLVTTHFTRDQIPYLMQPQGPVPLQRRFNKKHLLVGCAVVMTVQGVLLVALRLLDLLPANGDPKLLALLVVDAVLLVYLATIALVMFTSMVADTLDVQELETGLRQEGLFGSAIGFSAKATSGFGLLLAGVLLDGVIGFPAATGSATDVSPDVVFRLGVVSGFVVPLANIVWMMLALRYGITRDRHAAVRRLLDERRAHVAAQLN